MKTNKKISGIKVKANVKAGGLNFGNHSRGRLKVKAGIRAGEILQANHCVRLVRLP